MVKELNNNPRILEFPICFSLIKRVGDEGNKFERKIETGAYATALNIMINVIK